MAKYTVQDTRTGKTVTFEWNGESPPTEADMEQVFTEARVGQSPGTTPAVSRPSTSITDYFTKTPDRPSSLKEFVTGNIPRSAANTLYGLASVGPVTALPLMAADAVTKGPRTRSALEDLAAIRKDPSEALTRTWNNVKGMAKGIAAPFGLGDAGKYAANTVKGGPLYALWRAATQRGETPLGESGADEFVDAWTREPVQSALAVVPLAKGASAGARGAVRNLKDISKLPERLVKQSAAKQLEGAISPSGKIRDQAAINAVESDALAKRIGGGWRVGMGQQTGDPRLLALQRRLQMNSDPVKTFVAESEMVNNQALAEYLDKVIASGGSVDDVIASLERRGQSLARGAESLNQKTDVMLDNIIGQSQGEAGAALRGMAQAVKNKLRGISQQKYGKVPVDMKMDSTPLYQTIQEMGDDFDAAFQRLNATPTGTMKRAGNALEPEISPILGPDGKPFSTGVPQEMTFKQVMDFRSQVSNGERTARAAGDADLARKFRQLREGAEKTLELAEQSGMGEGVQALREANAFYRDTYVPTVRHGATGRVLKPKRTGEMSTETALVGGEYFKPGAKGVAAADSFNRTFAGNAEAKQALRDHAANSLYNYAKNPMTGEIEGAKVARWLARHKDALQKLDFGGEFSGIKNAAQAAEAARAEAARFNKSRFGQVLKADADKSMDYLFSGENLRNSVKTMKELMEFTADDAAARQGLKRAFADMFIKKSRVYAKDTVGVRNPSAAKGEGFLDKFEPAMKVLYSKEEMQCLRDIHKAVDIGSRINKTVSGVTGSQTAGLSPMSAGEHLMKSYLPLNPKFRVLRVIFEGVKGGYATQVNEYLARAMFDPATAKELLNVLKVSRAKGAKQGTRMLERLAVANAAAEGARTGATSEEE